MMRRVNEKIIIWVCVPLFLVSALWSDANAQAGRGGGVPRETLPETVRSYDVKDYFVPSDLKKTGIIHNLDGGVVVIHKASKEAYFGVEGDVIHENDTLVTLEDSRCRIRFLNEDVVTMASETNFTVESYLDQKDEGRKGSTFRLLKGKAMFYALRLFQYREARMTLNTPTAVVGVRGTKFGADVYSTEEGKISEAGIKVADLGNEIGMYLAQVGPERGGGKVFTDCFSEDGYLDVNGKLVGPGQMYRGETKMVMPTPPEYVRVFESQTEVRKEEKKPGTDRPGREGKEEGKGERSGEKKDEKGPKPGGPPPPPFPMGMMPDGGFDPMRRPPGENLMNIASREGARRIEAGTDPLMSEGKVAGQGSFIAGMMVEVNADGIAYNDANRDPMYFSRVPNLLNAPDGLESHIAYENAHSDNDQYKMVVEEINQGMDMKVNYFTLNHAGDKSLPSPHVFQWQKGGGYVDAKGHEYLTWGWWQDTQLPLGQIGSDPVGPQDFFAAKGTIWAVEGDLTHPDYIDLLQRQNASFGYNGMAKGVFASSAAASVVHFLTGSFACQVNFGSRQVSSVNIDVSESGNFRVNLQGGSGSVNTNGTFLIPGSSFAAGSTINGHSVNTGGETGANGAFFGPKAEGVGGTWHANGGPTNQYWATGEFHGQR